MTTDLAPARLPRGVRRKNAYADAASTKNSRTHPASSPRWPRSGAAKIRATAEEPA
ncbi:hypothetical protein ACS3YM_01480 [Nocardia sp. N13]|uniref:hypothetical protein n=1 Tax=Nocardioides sp. N13(2025) TaxID=3453405 RepID=UPI003F75C4CC